MADVSITDQSEYEQGWVYLVEAGGYKFKVSLPRTYYEKLTRSTVSRQAEGKASPDKLIMASFEFLLEREPAGSILPDFELPTINRYFPEYEIVIKEKLK